MRLYHNKKRKRIKYNDYRAAAKSYSKKPLIDNKDKKYKLKLYADYDLYDNYDLYASCEIDEYSEEYRMYSNWKSVLIPALVLLPNITSMKNSGTDYSEKQQKPKVEKAEKSKIPDYVLKFREERKKLQLNDSTTKQKPKLDTTKIPRYILEFRRSRTDTKKDTLKTTKSILQYDVIEFFKEVVKWQMAQYEGGYSDDRYDPGNYYKGQLLGTKHGISADFAGRLGITKEKLKNLSIDEAADILVGYASINLNTNPDTTSKDFIVIYSLYVFYYGKEKAYFDLTQYCGVPATKEHAERLLSEEPLNKEIAEYLKKSFEKRLLNSFMNDLARPIPLYSAGWYRRYVETLAYWKEAGHIDLKPSAAFLREAGKLLKEAKEKRILAQTTQPEQTAEPAQQPEVQQKLQQTQPTQDIRETPQELEGETTSRKAHPFEQLAEQELVDIGKGRSASLD